MKNIFDFRQSIFRGILKQLGLANLIGGNYAQKGNLVVSAINTELDYPLRVHASFPTVDAKINFSDASTTAADGAKKVPSPVSSQVFTGITGAFINFQTQAVSNAADFDITFPVTNTVGRFRRVAFMLISSGKIKVVFSDEELTEGALPNAGTLFNDGTPLGYVDLECTNAAGYFKTAASVTNVIENAKIYRFGSGAGSGASTEEGAAQEEPIANGATSVVVNFPTPLSGTSYVVLAQMVNTTDTDPQYQEIIITNRTINGFTAKWNAPTDSANYTLSYIVPRVQEQVGESVVSAGVTTATITLPIALTGTNYAIVAGFVNTVDASPQFQPLVVTNKTATTFTVKWNAPTGSADYRIGFRVAEYQ